MEAGSRDGVEGVEDAGWRVGRGRSGIRWKRGWMERWANSQEIPRFRGGYRLGKEIAGEYTWTQRKTADEDLHGEWICDRRAREGGERRGDVETG